MTRNRHPVDELADIRAEQKRLKDREDELRQMIISGQVGPVGDQHEASIRETVSERLDTAAVRKEFGLAKLRPFLKPSTTTVITVKPRELLEDAG